ncbi:condensation domain-containing protein [Kitasatospora sp. NPDC008050]|uniref:condensation domain-containing protein n=1 Tax=Kitasatospora sp. NPDC008050 TaxID=3364021 RepID=UPI0036E4BAAE
MDHLSLVCTSGAEVLGAQDLDPDANFFAHGGSSLKAARLCGRLRKQLGRPVPLELLFRHPVLREFAAALAQLPAPVPRPAAAEQGTPGADRLPVTPAQQRSLLRDHEHRTLGAPAHVRTVPWCVLLQGPVEERALATALAALPARHDALRTVFRLRDGVGEARVLPEAEVALQVRDLSGLPAESRLPRALALAAETAGLAFDPREPTRLRAVLHRLAPDRSVLLLVSDHNVCDGRSADILGADLARLYTREVRRDARELPEVPVQFSTWVADRHGPAGRREQRARLLPYWTPEVARNRFFPQLDLPIARPTGDGWAAEGIRHRSVLPNGTADAMEDYARRHNTTLFTVHAAGFVAYLHAVTGERDITICAPDDLRGADGVEHTVGWLATAVALRFRLPQRPTFDDVVTEVRRVLLGAMDHRGPGYRDVLDAGSTPQQGAPTVIFFEYTEGDDAQDAALLFGDTPATGLPLPMAGTTAGLSLWSRRTPEGLVTTVVHAGNHLDEAAMEDFLAGWRALANRAVTACDLPPAGTLQDSGGGRTA